MKRLSESDDGLKEEDGTACTIAEKGESTSICNSQDSTVTTTSTTKVVKRQVEITKSTEKIR